MVPTVTPSTESPYRHFDGLPLGVCIVLAGRVVYANAAMLTLLGRPREEVVGALSHELLIASHAGDSAERHLLRQQGEPVPSVYEALLRTPTGERWLEVSISVNGEEMVVVSRDISSRVRHRTVLQRLAELGAALPAARTEEEVLRRVFTGLAELELTHGYLLSQGEQVHLKRLFVAPGLLPGGPSGPQELDLTGRCPPLLSRTWREGSAYADDLPREIASFVGPVAAEWERTVRRLAELRVIGVRIDVEGAPRAVLVVCADWLRAEELPALRLFGAQVSAALEAAHAISRLSAQNTALTALNRLACAAVSALEPRAFFEQGAEEIRAFLGCDAIGILFPAAEPEELELAYVRGLAPSTVARFTRLPLDNSLSAGVIRTGELLVLDVESCPPYTRESMLSEGFSTLAVVPLRVRSRVEGTLAIAFRRPRQLSELERETLKAMGAHFAAATESHRLLREVRGRAEHLALINEVGRSLMGTLAPETLLEAGARGLARLVDVPDAYGTLLDPAGQRVEIRAAIGRHPELLGQYLPSEPPSSSLAALALRSREILVVEDGRVDPRVNKGLRQQAEGIAYLVVPLVVHERPIGVVLMVDSRRPRRFTSAEVERVSALANQLALALEGARLVEDLKKSCAELARTQEQLVQRERLAALGELSAVVAHEVRNPLGAIFNTLAMLRRNIGSDSPMFPLVEILGEEAARLNRIVDDLLDFARPLTPNPSPVPLERLLDEAVHRALADATRPVRVEWALAGDVPPVPVDELMMRQAFLNLALNAVQAMVEGGTLRVGLRLAPGVRPGVEVEFSDTGPGIPAEARARIFEPFFTTRAKGTGLGLAFVKRVVESHLGRVSLESTPGQGTSIRLFLPVESAPRPPVRMNGV